MDILSLLLQVATLGLVVYLLVQFKALFREVRTPVVRQKGQLPADFRDRLRNLPRPGNDAAKERVEGARDNREGRENRGENRGDRNRDDRGPRGENRGDRNRDDRGPRGENRGDRNRDDRGPRGENRGDRNRDDRGPRGENRGDRNRDDRGPRPQRTEAPAADAAAPAASAESAPAAAAAPAPAPSFGGRRPLGPSSSAESAPVEASTPDALAPASLAQPVNSDSPIRHGRRALPKAKPRFDDEPEATTEASA